MQNGGDLRAATIPEAGSLQGCQIPALGIAQGNGPDSTGKP